MKKKRGTFKSLRWKTIFRYFKNADTQSVAKRLRGLRSTWFSMRSVVYLALGKPVVIQDTGFQNYYPVGEGLSAFTILADAVSAVETIESDYRCHCQSARSIAESDFAARQC
jgi:hypothetical protein